LISDNTAGMSLPILSKEQSEENCEVSELQDKSTEVSEQLSDVVEHDPENQSIIKTSIPLATS